MQARICSFLILTVVLAARPDLGTGAELPFVDAAVAGEIRGFVLLSLMGERDSPPRGGPTASRLLAWAEQACARLEAAAGRPTAPARVREDLLTPAADLRAGAAELAAELERLPGLGPEERARAAAELLSRLDAAAPYGAFEPLPRSLGGTVRRPSRLPEYRRSRVRPAFLEDVPAAPRPVLDDLGPTGWIPHPDLRACALERCGGDWKEIYRFMRTEIEYEHAYGAGQAPELTLLRASGNDFDQAALLVALLRIAGVPCRYLYGTMELGEDDAAAVLPGADPGVLGRIFGGTGRPGASVTRETDGRATRIFEEHIAVEAWIAGEGRWVLLDPAWTPEMRPAWDPVAPPSTDNAVAWDAWPGSIESVHVGVADLVRADLMAARADREEAGSTRAPDRRKSLGRFVTYLAEGSEIEPSLHHRLRTILNNDGGAVTSRWLAASGLRFPGVLVRYERGGDAPPGGDWPLAALGMRARILCDGELLAEGAPCAPGRPDMLTVEIESPDGSRMQLRKRLRAASLTSIVMDYGGAAPGAEGDRVERLSALALAQETGGDNHEDTLRRLGRIGLVYLASVRVRTGILADRLGVRAIVRTPSVVACSLSPVESDPSFPPARRGYELTVDQLSNEHASVAVGVDATRTLDYTFGAGIVSSLLEHAVLDACEGGPALSTTRLIAQAVRDPELGLRADRRDGVIRIWTEGTARVAAWDGGAILSLEPESLAGFYELAGGIRGGVLGRSIPEPSSIGPMRLEGGDPAAWPGGAGGAGAFALYLAAARQRSGHPQSWWQGPLAGILAAEELEAARGGPAP